MPYNLEHIRAIAEQAASPSFAPPHAGVEVSERGAEWLLLLLPIVEKVALDDDAFAGEYDCLFCHGRVHYGGDEVEPFVDHVEHTPECPVAMAKALKEGIR